MQVVRREAAAALLQFEAGRAGAGCGAGACGPRCGVRPPFVRLQGAQAVTMFSQVVRPPRSAG